jgi:hypothetical protein
MTDFKFNHDVLVLAFHCNGACQLEPNKYLTFTEGPAPLNNVRVTGKRVAWNNDGNSIPQLPNDLLKSDQVWTNLYRVKGESVSQSKQRCTNILTYIINACSNDLGVVGMFYDQGGLPPNELWLVSEVLDWLAELNDLVNLSPRIKVVAAFAFRKNGIGVHPELTAAYNNLELQSKTPNFIPIDAPVVIEKTAMKIDTNPAHVVTNFFTDYEDVTELPHPTDAGFVCYQLPNGKYKSMNLQGNWDPDKDVAGAWERFNRWGSVIKHNVSGAVISGYAGV